jgi:hypothetical protein
LIGCLVADRSDATIVTNLAKAAGKQGCQVKVIAPKIGQSMSPFWFGGHSLFTEPTKNDRAKKDL